MYQERWGSNSMKDFIIKLTEAAIILILLILFIFVLADCKMESEKLRLKIALLEDENEKLRIETQEIRKAYSAILTRLIDEKKVSIIEISSLLPAKEFEIFTTIQDEQGQQ